jgi:hypothetical protein
MARRKMFQRELQHHERKDFHDCRTLCLFPLRQSQDKSSGPVKAEDGSGMILSMAVFRLAPQ